MARIVHTSDWHLGARLLDCERLPEQALFLDWLLAQLEQLRPTLLLVAGDIFDTANPSQQALGLYYNFLARLSASPARCKVLILGGNHDSPATLEAPASILQALDVRIVGQLPRDPADCVTDEGEYILCAVPYLRERDVRSALPGQDYLSVANAVREGVRSCYARVLDCARARAEGRPIIGSGHLAVAGCQQGESERLIHIGNLGAIGVEAFAGFDYVALGHIHRVQALDTKGAVRYTGSPVALSFSEAGVGKELRVIDVQDAALSHYGIAIPSVRQLVRLACPLASLQDALSELQTTGSEFEPWVELTVSDGREYPDLQDQVRARASGFPVRVLKVLVPALEQGSSVLEPDNSANSGLEALRPLEVFHERLRAAGVEAGEEAWRQLEASFLELEEWMHSKEAGQ